MAKSNLYRFKRVSVNGKQVYVKEHVSTHEVKKAIMKENRWTESQYQKKYDLFKNKLRAKESFEIAHGLKVERQSPVEVLYKQAQAKERARKSGQKYTPSIAMKRIQSFSAVSITKGRALAQDTESSYSQRSAKVYERSTTKAFRGLIEKNAKAKEIATKVKDPVKREQALKDYAEKIHAKMDEEGKAQEDEAIPHGESYGSDESTDFDYSQYLDDDYSEE